MFSRELIEAIRLEVEENLMDKDGNFISIGADGEKTIKENLEVMMHSFSLSALGILE